MSGGRFPPDLLPHIAAVIENSPATRLVRLGLRRTNHTHFRGTEFSAADQFSVGFIWFHWQLLQVQKEILFIRYCSEAGLGFGIRSGPVMGNAPAIVEPMQLLEPKRWVSIITATGLAGGYAIRLTAPSGGYSASGGGYRREAQNELAFAPPRRATNSQAPGVR